MSESIDNLSPNPTKCSINNKIFSDQKKHTFIKNKKYEPSIQSQKIDKSITSSFKNKIKKRRCHTCRKKLGLVSFSCKCKFVFCSKHRYIDQHHCTYDYKKHYEIEYLKKNQKIGNNKIRKL